MISVDTYLHNLGYSGCHSIMTKTYGNQYYKTAIKPVLGIIYDHITIRAFTRIAPDFGGIIVDKIIKQQNIGSMAEEIANINNRGLRYINLQPDQIMLLLKYNIDNLRDILTPVIEFFSCMEKDVVVQNSKFKGIIDFMDDSTIYEVKCGHKYDFTDTAWVQLMTYKSILNEPKTLRIFNACSGFIYELNL